MELLAERTADLPRFSQVFFMLTLSLTALSLSLRFVAVNVRDEIYALTCKDKPVDLPLTGLEDHANTGASTDFPPPGF